MASAEYEVTNVDDNVGRNIEQRSYEECNAYENEERVIGAGPPNTQVVLAMPSPQLLQNPPQQDAERSHETQKYGLKWLTVALVIVTVIFAGMFAAVFVMTITGRDQGGSHKLQNQNETKDLRQDFQSKMTQLENKLLQNQNATEDLRQDFQSKIAQLVNKLKNVAEQSNDGLDWIMDHIGPWYKASNGLWYKLFSEKKNHTEAESDCRRIGGARLVSTGIRSQAVRSEIWTNVMLSKAKNVWIGLNQPYLASGNDSWIWMDGAAYNKSNTPWHSGEPNNVGKDGNCAHIWSKDTTVIKLADNRCAWNYFAYICEKEL